MTTLRKLQSIWLATALGCALSSQAAAGLITNGTFESGFTGWTRADQAGGDGTFNLQSGTMSPISGDPVPAPPGGTTAAMTDAQGPGAHALFQTFVVPSLVPSASLHFDLFVGNRADRFVTPNTLDFFAPGGTTTVLNQQARVDILVGSAGAFSLLPAELLMNAYRTNVGDPLVSGYTHLSFDVTSVLNAHLGQTLMLRFAETDDLLTFQLGVDNVDIDISAVPEPATWSLLLGAGGIALILRRLFHPIDHNHVYRRLLSLEL